MSGVEVNFDGLVGPTHNYAGLSFGNVASKNHAQGVSYPKAAAKQGLRKMRTVSELGLTQGVLAPNARPDLSTMKRLGFSGTDHQIINKVAKQAPALLASLYSASSMWTANAATVSPSGDTADGKVHFTPANLNNKLHRAIEPDATARILSATFANNEHFTHHKHLPEHETFGDEGAANHTRFCGNYDGPGVEFFVYGRSAFDPTIPAPSKFPARQTLEASQAIARLHGLDDKQCVYALQSPKVIDQGVFHNDVIAVGNQNALFYHEAAFHDTQKMKNDIKRATTAVGIEEMHFIEVPTSAVTVSDAVKSYLFNTQLLTINNNTQNAFMALIAPLECRENSSVHAYLNALIAGASPIKEVHYIDVKQSMQNGGGPACLRLRVTLNQAQLEAVNPATILTSESFSTLDQWIDKHYRDELSPADLADPNLLVESYTALDELTQILNLGSVYPFQTI